MQLGSVLNSATTCNSAQLTTRRRCDNVRPPDLVALFPPTSQPSRFLWSARGLMQIIRRIAKGSSYAKDI
jgi:hypothetical protein